MAIRKRKWKTGGSVQTAWSYVFDAPGSTRENRKQIFESGFASKKEAQDAETARRIKAQREFELRKATPAEVPGTLAGLLKEFFTEHGAKVARRRRRCSATARWPTISTPIFSPCRSRRSSRCTCRANGTGC